MLGSELLSDLPSELLGAAFGDEAGEPEVDIVWLCVVNIALVVLLEAVCSCFLTSLRRSSSRVVRARLVDMVSGSNVEGCDICVEYRNEVERKASR